LPFWVVLGPEEHADKISAQSEDTSVIRSTLVVNKDFEKQKTSRIRKRLFEK